MNEKRNHSWQRTISTRGTADVALTVREIVQMISKSIFRTWERSGWERISPLDAADKAELLGSGFGRTWNKKHQYQPKVLLHSFVNNQKHNYLQISTHYLRPPGNVFERRRRRPLIPSSPKRGFLQKVIVLSDQCGRRQQEVWRLEEVRHHKPGCSCLTIHDEEGESAEIVKVPWRRCFHIKISNLALANPPDSCKDKVSYSCRHRKSRQNISKFVFKIMHVAWDGSSENSWYLNTLTEVQYRLLSILFLIMSLLMLNIGIQGVPKKRTKRTTSNQNWVLWG